MKQLQKLLPNADYDHLTLVGHSNGGDTAMYFAKQHPELVSKVVTLDNLRVPFVLNENVKILSFRSRDPSFQTDPGVLPDPAQQRIQATLDQFLSNGSASELAPANTDNLIVTNTGAPQP